MAAEEAVLRSRDATAALYGTDSTAAAMSDLRLGTIRVGARRATAASNATFWDGLAQSGSASNMRAKYQAVVCSASSHERIAMLTASALIN